MIQNFEMSENQQGMHAEGQKSETQISQQSKESSIEEQQQHKIPERSHVSIKGFFGFVSKKRLSNLRGV
jgi:hypothetical protein